MSRVDAQWNWRPAFTARAQGRDGLRAAAERVKNDAVRRAPFRTGNLRSSAGVTMDEGRAIVHFDAPYATIVHERLDLRHATGEAKYLERAALEASGRLEGDVGRSIRL